MREQRKNAARAVAASADEKTEENGARVEARRLVYIAFAAIEQDAGPNSRAKKSICVSAGINAV